MNLVQVGIDASVGFVLGGLGGGAAVQLSNKLVKGLEGLTRMQRYGRQYVISVGTGTTEDSVENVNAELIKDIAYDDYEAHYWRVFVQGLGTGFVEGSMGKGDAFGIAVGLHPASWALPTALVLGD